MAKRTEKTIRADYEVARDEYHEQAATATVAELAKQAAKVKKFQQELTDYITEGAEPCPTCGQKPLGIHQPRYYEVGCLNCTVDGQARRAIGDTREEAVEAWNNGELFFK